ncbi:MAG: SPOR domain-containing protein [Paracoccus sp. (in: a-proteobacteria)]|nr:SPOR domain-containing protein [Paracoccus sp. (in: a-proteobacteria)]
MRLLICFGFIWALLAPGLRAMPAELPPRDFAGAQYIDSTGCVFRREGRGWVALSGDDGAPVCGFPPSAILRRDDTRMPEGAEIERDLLRLTLGAPGAEVEFSGRPDLTGIGKPAAPPPASQPQPQADPAGAITRQLAAGRRLAGAGAGQDDPNLRLCTLLGLQPAGAAPARIGADPTGGYCSGEVAPPALVENTDAGAAPDDGSAARLAAAAPRSSGHAGGAAPQVAAPAASPGAGPPVHAAASGPAPASKPSEKPKAVVAAGDGAQVAPLASGGEMIPAGARYIQIGRFDLDEAEAKLRALSAMGYPVAREKIVGVDGMRFVMAGPFPTREGLVVALDRLRKAGYPGAVAR